MKKISVIIPVYNEERHLVDVLDRILSVNYGAETEFIVVDNHSTDSSWEILCKYSQNKKNMTIFQQTRNFGKGSSLHRGFELATGDIIAIQDADFEYDPQDLCDLLKPILSDQADVVYGSRFKKSNLQVHRTFHYLMNRFLTFFSNLMSGLYLTDMETCYKVFRSDILKNIPLDSKRFGFEPEVTAKIAKLGLRVYELPISYYPRTVLQGKKVNWRDGLEALWLIVKYNLTAVDYSRTKMPEKFFKR